MKEICDLPPEVLVKCFHYLHPPDLKSCVLVSEEWRAVGEDPSLWTWCTVTIRNKEDREKLIVWRLRKIHTIRIEQGGNWDTADWETLLQDISANGFPHLKEIKMRKLSRNAYLVEVEPGTLAKALIKLEVVDFSNCFLSTDQINSLLTSITREEIKLKKLNLFGNDLSGVKPQVLARALIKLEEVNLWGTTLRPNSK